VISWIVFVHAERKHETKLGHYPAVGLFDSNFFHLYF
jgi:hypothetical protein